MDVAARTAMQWGSVGVVAGGLFMKAVGVVGGAIIITSSNLPFRQKNRKI